MSQERTFNPQIVHDAAAFLFWSLAESIGVTATNDTIMETSGKCLLRQPFTWKVLGNYKIDQLPAADQHAFCCAVTAEAVDFASRQLNMQGVIYAEDAENGRSPSAVNTDTSILAVSPHQVIANGPVIEKIGRLCIRHPLPAVVFSESPPVNRLIEIAETTAALGFHHPIFLSDFETQQLGPNIFVSGGIFHIPVPNTAHGDLWDSVIQNSIRFVDSIKFHWPSGITSVEVQW